MRSHHLLPAALLLLAGMAAGCGYKGGFLMPAGVRTVHVEVVGNDTLWHEAVKTHNLPSGMAPAEPRPSRTMELELTERLKNEIVRRTPYRLADADKADTVLRATIVDVAPQTLYTDSADVLLAQRVTVSVNFDWVERRSGRVLASGRGMSRPTVFVTERGENFTTAARKSFDYVAERIVEEMQDGF